LFYSIFVESLNRLGWGIFCWGQCSVQLTLSLTKLDRGTLLDTVHVR
jgi:hypothetical protein